MSFSPNPKPPHRKKKRSNLPSGVVIAVFERDNYTCQYTGKHYKPEQHSLHVHHRVFKGMGRSSKDYDRMDNLASCDWEYHQDHGQLKHARILSEGVDNSKINELEARYR